MDPITIVNIALCVIIVLLGVLGYRQKKDKAPLFVGVAFGLFGLSHVLKLVGLEATLMNLIITIRVIAYLIVAIALWMFVAKD